MVVYIMLFIVGVIIIGCGIWLLFSGKKKDEDDVTVISKPGRVIKIAPNKNSSMFPPGVGKNIDPDYIVMGDIFNSQGSEPDSLGEFEIMTRLSFAFREGKVSASVVKMAEERINLYINDDIWEEKGGRSAVMETTRDARLASLRYTEFIQALKSILENGSYNESITYLDDEDKSYDYLQSDPDEVAVHEDFDGIEHSEDINSLPVSDFELNAVLEDQSGAIINEEDKKSHIKDVIASNVSGGGHLSHVWRLLDEDTL